MVSGRYNALNGESVGASATLACDYGHHASGEGITKTCAANGNSAYWTPASSATCVASNTQGHTTTCTSLRVLNGVARYHTAQGQSALSPEIGGYATVSCNPGYSPSGGAQARQTCEQVGTAGQWSTPTITCTASSAACPAITVTGGTVSYDVGGPQPSQSTRSATVRCSPGYHLPSEAVTEVHSCSAAFGAAKQWSPAIPGNTIVCSAQHGGAATGSVACPALQAAHGTVVYDTGTLTSATRSATVSCESMPFGTVYKTPSGAAQEHVNCELAHDGVSYNWAFPPGRTANTLCVEYHAQSQQCTPLTITGGYYTFSNGQNDESVATLHCNNGLSSNNPTAPPRVCHRGQWSPSYPPLACINPTQTQNRRSCQALNVAGGTITYTDPLAGGSAPDGSVAHVSCNTGSTVSNWMHPTQTCGQEIEGQWSTPAVTCVQNGNANPFGPPPPPTTARCSALTVLHGVVHYSGGVAGAASYGTGDTATIACNPNYHSSWVYTPTQPHPARTCANGVWSGADITCTGTGVAPPPPPNPFGPPPPPTNPFGPPPPPPPGPPCSAVMMTGGTARYSTQPTQVLGQYRYLTNTVATITCEAGYRASTSGTTETQVCSPTGQWTAQGGGTAPTCVTDAATAGVCAAEPCGQHGTCRPSGASYRCACSTDMISGARYVGDTCKCLESESTCLHGTSTPAEPTFGAGPCTWTCNCGASGYAGPNCETASTHPSTGVSGCNAGGVATCQNGGTCTSFVIMGAPHTNCQCATGWSGDTCTVQGQAGTSTGGNTGTIGTGQGDSCAAMPCQNGGTCIDVFGHFNCQCAAGYGGETCTEHDTVNDCDHGANPCQHNGICSDSFFGFSCQCVPEQSQQFGMPAVQWGGPTCSTSSSGQDNCASQPCMNGGVCQSLFVGNDWTYTCTCPSNIFGTHCEQVDPVNDCINFPCCSAGGNCVDLFQSATCSCKPGFTGTECNTRTSDGLQLTTGECDSGAPPSGPQTGGGTTATARLGCTHTGASTCRQGRIEVFNAAGNEWGTVCGHWMWDNDDVANIVCRQLGFAYGTLYTFGVSLI